MDGRLVSVAVPFFLGQCYEDLGVVTEAAMAVALADWPTGRIAT